MKPQTMATLVQMARDIYPHDRIPDDRYAVAVKGYDTADKAPAVEAGIAALDAAARGKPLPARYPGRHDRPQRIVSLLPSATDLLFDLGLGPRLVGVSHSCDHPERGGRPVLTRSIVDSNAPQADIDRAVSSAVREGRALYQVDGPLLDTLAPDLVVTQGVCEVCAVTPGTIETAVRYLPGCLPAAGVPFSAPIEDAAANCSSPAKLHAP